MLTELKRKQELSGNNIIKLVKHRRALLTDANTNGNDVCHYFDET